MTPTNTMVAVQLAKQAAPRPTGTYLPNPHPLGADQTTAINTVLAAVPSGGTVIVGDRYRVDGQLSITTAMTVEFSGRGEFYSSAGTATQKMIRVTSSNVHLIGSGKITGPQYAATADQTIVSFEGTSGSSPLTNVSVEGLTLSQSGKYGIYSIYVKGFAFDRNTVKNCCYAGIGALSAINGSINNNVVENITQTGYTQSYGIYTTRNSVALTADEPRSENISICNNRVVDVPNWDGVNTHGGKSHTISGNVIVNTKNGIELVACPTTGGGGVDTLAPLDMTVTGNVIRSTVSDGSRGAGITLVGASGSGGVGSPDEYATGTITGNIIRGHGNQASSISGAIQIYYSKGVPVVGNTIIEPSPHGINFYHDNLGFVCQSNVIIDPWTTAGANAAAINMASSYNVGHVAGNSLQLNGKSATLIANRGIAVFNQPGTSITLGSNDMVAATAPVSDTGSLSVSVAGNPGKWVPADNLLISCDGDPLHASSNLLMATAGVIYVRKMKMAATSVITNIKTVVTSAGSVLSDAYFAVFDSAGTRLGVTADASTTLQSTGEKTIALATPTSARTAGTWVYVALVIGAWTTAPTFAAYPTGRSSLGLTTSALRWGSVSSGLSAMPSTITPGSIATVSSAVPLWALS